MWLPELAWHSSKRLPKLSVKLAISSWRSSFQVFCVLAMSCSRFFGRGSMKTESCSLAQTCSMGLRSGEFPGHFSRTWTPEALIWFIVLTAVWHVAQSCIRRACCCLETNVFTVIISRNSLAFRNNAQTSFAITWNSTTDHNLQIKLG